MSRIALLIAFVVIAVGTNSIHSLDSEMQLIEIMLNDSQRVRIVPLYQDFDLFYGLMTGDITAADLPREERYILTCAHNWFSVAEDFGFELPDVPSNRFLRRYRTVSESISDDIIDVVIQGLRDSSALLPSEDIILCIDPVNRRELTFSGTSSGTTFSIFVAQWNSVEIETASQLMALVAHEYHHHARFSHQDLRTSGAVLLERVVTEGMAEMFVTLVYPNYVNDWVINLSERQEAYIWSVFEPISRSTDIDTHRDFMLGEMNRLPPNAGYGLGYRIMSAFVENNPDISIQEWTLMSGDEIFLASDYMPPNP